MLPLFFRVTFAEVELADDPLQDILHHPLEIKTPVKFSKTSTNNNCLFFLEYFNYNGRDIQGVLIQCVLIFEELHKPKGRLPTYDTLSKFFQLLHFPMRQDFSPPYTSTAMITASTEFLLSPSHLRFLSAFPKYCNTSPVYRKPYAFRLSKWVMLSKGRVERDSTQATALPQVAQTVV